MRVDKDLTASTHGAFQERIEPLRAGLLGLIDRLGATADEHDEQAAPGSIADREMPYERQLRARIGGQPLLTARSIGAIQLNAAQDHFSAYCRLLTHVEPVLYGGEVLVRAGIEASARALWLLDPTITHEVRLQRCFTEQLYDHFQVHRMYRPEDRAAHMKQRDRIVADARTVGLFTKVNKKAPAYVRDPRPDATSAMIALFDRFERGSERGRFLQHYLSMFVHSTFAGLKLSLDVDAAIDRGDGIVSVPVMASTTDVNRLLVFASVAYVTIASEYLEFMGWLDHGWAAEASNHAALIGQYKGLFGA